MSDLPSMPFFVDDYEAATAHLTLEQDGLYSRLLRLCWRTAGCSVPSDPAWLARHLRISGNDFERIAAPLIAEFFMTEGGRIFQKRQRREFAYVKDVREKRKAAGKKGGSARVADKPLKTNKTTSSKPQAPHFTSPTHIEDHPSDDAQAREPSPLEILKEGMDEETAKAVIQHRKAVKAPLTPLGAKGLVKAFAEYPGGVRAAAEMMVTNGWRGFKREYWDKGQPRGSPPNGGGIAAVAARLAKELANADIRPDQGIERPQPPVLNLPAPGRQQ